MDTLLFSFAKALFALAVILWLFAGGLIVYLTKKWKRESKE